MAMLYERSALWRAIVHATRRPRIMILFSCTMCASAYALAAGAKTITDQAAESTKSEMEERIVKDREAKRYAQHSKNALAVMLREAGREDVTQEKAGEHEIKLPGVAWHPKAEDRGKRGE